MKFSIVGWRALSSYHETESDWLSWINNKNIQTEQAKAVDLAFLPAMQRRRLSALGRLMFAAAWPLLEVNESCPLVYVSHDGEINRSFQLWQELCRDRVVSPTSFALSVHNAVAGQWSLIRQDRSDIIALSTSESSVELAMVEACGLLKQGNSKVIIVIADEPLADEYSVFAERAPFSYALAIVVTAGDDWCLELNAVESQGNANFTGNLGAFDAGLGSVMPPSLYFSSALSWIEHTLQQRHTWRQEATYGTWVWQRVVQ